jgi:superfamily I DNA/RNA helicase
VTPTPSQSEVIEGGHAGLDLVVKAGAGAGKTQTLAWTAEGMRGSGLYAAYSKPLQLDAVGRFPRHVDCRTMHSLAFRAVGARYSERLNGPRQPAREAARLLRINQALHLDGDTLVQPTTLARLAVDTVDRYCTSADEQLTRRFVPRLNGLDSAEHDAVAGVAVRYAGRIWDDLQRSDDQGGGRFQFKHDHYLKLWQLGKPRLPYDFILYDEAQDANPVIADLIMSQDAQTIVVGDENQQLFAWRGAVDALSTWPADRELYLRESFRFGQAVADEGNKWLELLDTPMRIVGKGGPSRVQPVVGWPDAVLCRTNGTAMNEAMAAMADGKRVALVGGSKQIKALAEAAIDLKTSGHTDYHELAMFGSWDEVQAYVQDEASGSDLKTTVKLIDDHGPEEILDAVRHLVEESRPKGRNRYWTPPDVVVSTAHKSKGRQWPVVRVAGDFTPPVDKETGERKPVTREDAMLAYVTVTRAEKVLDRGGLAWIDELGRSQQLLAVA